MGASSTPRIYLDTCVFLEVLLDRENASICTRVLSAAERGDVRLVASRLLPVEIAAWHGEQRGQRTAGEFVDRFLDGVETEWVELDVVAVRDAIDLSWRYRLRSADSIHLATAVRRNADYFMSYDERFPYGTAVGGVEVCRPKIVWNPTIDDQLGT